MVGLGTSRSQYNACHMSLKYQYLENIFQVLKITEDNAGYDASAYV